MPDSEPIADRLLALRMNMNPQTGNKRCHTEEDRTKDAKGELL
jgi:hypothetical protein